MHSDRCTSQQTSSWINSDMIQFGGLRDFIVHSLIHFRPRQTTFVYLLRSPGGLVKILHLVVYYIAIMQDWTILLCFYFLD